MTSISSVNSTALLILQQASASRGAQQAAGGETDTLKVANGISSEPSEGKKSAAAAIGKFAIDTAPSKGKIVMAELGAADSWEEMRERVDNNAKFTDGEKKTWHARITELQELFASAEEFKASDLYQSLVSGELKPPPIDDLPTAMSEELAQRKAGPLSDFLATIGRDPLHERTRASLIMRL